MSENQKIADLEYRITTIEQHINTNYKDPFDSSLHVTQLLDAAKEEQKATLNKMDQLASDNGSLLVQVANLKHTIATLKNELLEVPLKDGKIHDQYELILSQREQLDSMRNQLNEYEKYISIKDIKLAEKLNDWPVWVINCDTTSDTRLEQMRGLGIKCIEINNQQEVIIDGVSHNKWKKARKLLQAIFNHM